MHVQNLICGSPNPLNHHRSHGNVGDKVSVHDIDVDHGSTSLLALIQCKREVGKISGK
jgi:hypothetical protein